MKRFILEKDGIDYIDGSGLQNEWFPKCKADIFLSHSHEDEKLCIALAGWITKKFNLTVFIDSCVWGYANDLLRDVDNKYCKLENGLAYSYESRNISTSHIHMMLSTALASVMDETECLIFLNTPNSMKTGQTIKEEITESPWIYDELVLATLMRSKIPERRSFSHSIEEYAQFNEINESAMIIEYKAPVQELEPLDMKDLQLWEKGIMESEGVYPLDIIYKNKGFIIDKEELCVR